MQQVPRSSEGDVREYSTEDRIGFGYEITGDSMAKANDISISLDGINLDKKGKQLAEKIVEIGQGRLYLANNIKDLDLIVLEDYLCFS